MMMIMMMVMAMKMIEKLEIMKILEKVNMENIKREVETERHCKVMISDKVLVLFLVKANCWVVVSTTKNC